MGLTLPVFRSMTSGAQQALRRTMEIYSSTTRFALACNQSSKIIEPIQSRCAIVRYAKLSDKELLERLSVVVQEERVRETEEEWTHAHVDLLVACPLDLSSV